jgi:hypothetical protein
VAPLGGKWRPPAGKVGEWYVESWHLQGCSPRLSRLRIDGLAPASKYWTYWSHAGVYGGFGREAGYGPMDHSAGLRVVSGALLLGSSESIQICWRLCERLLYVDHMKYVWSWTIRGLSVESVWRVGRVFPCKVYINSNRHDSRIWVTACLWQSSRR